MNFLTQARTGCCVLLILSALLFGCDRNAETIDVDAEPVGSDEGNLAAANTTDPHWVYPRNPQNKIAVVFIHGIFGDTNDTWTNKNGKTFFELLRNNPDVGSNVDIYAFGFTSSMIKNGSLKIGEAAVKLNEFLDYHKISSYDSVVFVAHSMGGLITMRELISHPELAKKVPLLVFYATPHEGSQITNIAEHVVRNPAVKQMFPVDGNDYLQQLNEDWLRVRSTVPHPTMVCAYETKPMGPDRIVPWSSSSRNCDTVAAAIEDSNHLSIVKPDRAEHPSVVLLVNALSKYVMPRMDVAVWETPDFRFENQQWTYPLIDINGRNGAVIANRGAIGQTYNIELLDADYMSMEPGRDTMPRYVAPSARDEIKLILVNELRPEYRLKLKLGSAPERTIIARITDMQAALAARAERQKLVADGINSYLAANTGTFNALSEDAQHKKFAQLASKAIAVQNPDLSQGTQLLVAADTLAAMNLPSSASAVLRVTEQRFSAVAKSQSARRLAGTIAAQSANQAFPGTTPIPSAQLDDASSRIDLKAADHADRASIDRLAERLTAIPSMQNEGLVLKGDILQAEGDKAGALRAYSAAKEIESTPLIRSRIRSIKAGADL